jgi:hypothetical protein
MANIDNANGFQPYLSPQDGCGGQAKVTYYPLAAANTAIGIGTPVTMTGAATVDIAGTTDALIGIAAEAKAASAGGTIAVWANPQQWFVAQTDDGTATMTTAANLGKNCTFVGTGVSEGRSTAEIDESSGSDTATLLFRALRLSAEYSGVNGVANAHGEFNRLVVKINNHLLQGGTGTAGQA